MPEFYQTMMGRMFYEGTIPSIAREIVKIRESLERIAVALEKQNERAASSSANDQNEQAK